MDRRQFIKKAGHFSILTALIGTSSYLVLREKSDEVCDLEFVCRDCKKQKTCQLPEKKL